MRVLTGDTPTGNLHLGHWVGSVKRRVEMQDSHECFFLVANMHAFTTRSDQPEDEQRQEALPLHGSGVHTGKENTGSNDRPPGRTAHQYPMAA